MKRILVLIVGLILITTLVFNCSKDGESLVDISTSELLENGQLTAETVEQQESVNGLDEVVEVSEPTGYREFTEQEMLEQDQLAGVAAWDRNIWDLEPYARYMRDYILTEDELMLVGRWIPVGDASNPFSNYQMTLWPNRIVKLEYVVGYAIGIWGISDDGKLKILVFAIFYPSGTGVGWLRERVNIIEDDIADLSIFHKNGYTTVPMRIVDAPTKLVDMFPKNRIVQTYYYYKALTRVDPTGASSPFVLVNYLEKCRAAGNPTAEQIMNEEIPNARELW